MEQTENTERPTLEAQKPAGKAAQWITDLLLLGVGIALVVLHKGDDMMENIIKLCGVALILPAIYSVFILLWSKHKPKPLMSFAWGVCAAAAVGLGVLMIVMTELFVATLGFLLSGLLIVGGMAQVVIMLLNHKRAALKSWLYWIPSLLIAGGAVTMFSSLRDNYPVVIGVTGVGIALYAVNDALLMFKLRRADLAEAGGNGGGNELDKPAEHEVEA